MIKIVEVSNIKDLKLVEKLAFEIWNEHYPPIIGQAQVDYMLDKFQSLEVMEQQIKDGYQYYLIQNNNDYVGYLSFQAREEKLFLSKVYVLSSERGKGIGKESFNFVFEQARAMKLKAVQLTVNKYNSGSIEAYKKLGYSIVQEIVMDIGGGYVMDDYVFEKQIS